MYSVSIWKLILIIVVLVFSALYLIPTPENFYNPLYGNLSLWMQERLPRFEATDENSLRVSLQEVEYPEGINLQDATMELEEILAKRLEANGFEEAIDYQFDITEERDFVVNFLSSKSRADLERVLEGLHLYGSIPTIVRRLIPDNRLKLGLDLRGGVHLVLEVDLEESKIELLKGRASSIPERLRADKIHCRVAEPVLEENALNVVVGIPKRLSDPTEQAEYLKTAQENLQDLEFFDDPQEVNRTDTEVTYQIRLDESGLGQYSEQAIDQVMVVLRNRIDAFGVAEPSIRREANRPRIIVELPGAKDSSKPLQIVKTMGRLEFKLVEKSPAGAIAWTGSADTPPPDDIPEGTEIRYHNDDGTSLANSWYVVQSPVLLSGDRIKNARETQGNTSFEIVVSMSFDSQGSRKFGEMTTNHVGELLAILLDGKIQSAPRINEPILGGNAQISGDFTFEEAQYLANILKAGAFPVGVKIAEERTVGPTLGQEAIDDGVRAAVIGMGIVLIFMLIYYRFSGIVAITALAFNMLIILGALAGFGAALTLPGLAGLVLTIGMAVDANVLIFERIREELRTRKTVWSAIQTGYQKAFWTILDANVTTLAVAAVLYHFGTGPIKGFAVTLGVGIFASMFTAIVVTREIYGWVLGGRNVERLSIGREVIRNTTISFLSRSRMGFTVSAILIIIGVVSLVLHNGPNFGIDFRGGVKTYAKFNRPVTQPELSAKLTELGYERFKIQVDAAKQEASIDIGYSTEFESQRVVVPLIADPGDATAMSIQVSATQERVRFQPGDAIQLIEGDHRLRNEISEVIEGEDTITFALVDEIGADLTQAAQIQVQASVGQILTGALLQGDGDWQAVPRAVSVNEVGPSVGKDLKWAALWSVIWSIVILLFYISWRFEFRFAIGAIAALIHDVLITLGVFSVFVKEINLPTVAAFLTIIGYSLNDTIVVFDRIRENSTLLKGTDFAEVINRSINQSLSRTVVTSLTTLFVVLVIFLQTAAGQEINTFALALIVGVIVGTYSSVFIASPIIYLWHLRRRNIEVQEVQESTA
ncbi:protein translocase subunit SecD [Candidatus Poribacteria bacterium]|nr:protein translocase subunit SecD [Candidatus Poribacteria bacterium]